MYLQTCGEVVYAGLVKKEKIWYDVTEAKPAQWTDWSNTGGDESYSDCAKLDISTGQSSAETVIYRLSL